MINVVEHTCLCGEIFVVEYEDGATVDPTCPQCGRQIELRRVGSPGHQHLEEWPKARLIERKESYD